MDVLVGIYAFGCARFDSFGCVFLFSVACLALTTNFRDSYFFELHGFFFLVNVDSSLRRNVTTRFVY